MTSVSMAVPFGPAVFPTSTSRPATAKPTRATKATKATKASQPKEAKGPNSDHRKEQNRIASKNYREKRKQKLALLRQILDEPAEGGTDNANVGANADSNTQSAAPAAPSYNVTAFPDTHPIVFPGFDNNFQSGMLTDLLSTDPLAVSSTQPATIASPDPLAAATTSSSWTAAESASHPSHPFSWMPVEPPLSAAASTITTPSDPLSMPLLSSWTVPFASDLAASFPPPPPVTSSSTTPLPLPSLPSLSSATPASSSTPSDTVDNLDGLGHFDLDQTLNPTLDLNVDLDLDRMMRSDLQAASFFNGMPVDSSLSFSQSKTKPTPAQMHATLPSRPSPRALWASLAQPGEPSNTFPPAPANTKSASATTDTANNVANLTGPSRRTRNKNKPVVRAMLQYVQTLSSHQKRLILQTLLDEGKGMPGDAERVGEVEEVEEIDGVDDMDEDDNDYNNENDDSPSSHYTSTTTPDAEGTVMKNLYAKRRRQVASRWNQSTKERAIASAAAAYTNISMSSLGTEYQAFAAGFSSTSPAARAQLPPTFMTMTLQCRRLTFCVAILQNCEACGLPNPAAMLDESCSVEDADGNSVENLQSPFALAADEARAVVTQGPARIAAVVAAVRQQIELRGKTPPKDLQPTDAQILVAHHPYIDTIPFRGFRARALALLAQMEADECIAEAAQQSAMLFYGDNQSKDTATPCLLDEDELCYDMNVADGLICWGSQIGNDGMGLSAQAMRDSSSTRDMRAGVPWDMRSWEPQVWFLKKYWYLVGGWDDDMWRNCRWWHSMRGEDLDYSVFAAPGY